MSTVDRDRRRGASQIESASILFPPGTSPPPDAAPEPAYFADLNLDQVLAVMVTGRERYRIEPFFHATLDDADAVRYRQEVLRELEDERVRELVERFAAGMGELRRCLELSVKLRNPQQRQRWLLAGIEAYCEAVTRFAESAAEHPPGSRGLTAVAEHAIAYAQSGAFRALLEDTDSVARALSEITYSVRIRGLRVTVDRHRGEPDLAAEVHETFSKFRQENVSDHLASFRPRVECSPVEDQILRLVARLFPDEFGELERYYARHVHSLDPTLERFDREVQYCLGYLEFIAPLRAAGLRFSYPAVSAVDKTTRARDTFDIALAGKLAHDGGTVVTNDLALDGQERILVITGPNQGGKTTFARTFGQLHHLAALGLPVPGTDTKLFLADRLFTHFERAEELVTLRSRFEEELHRMHEILEQATGDSVLVMNESFTSTALSDAVEVGTLVLAELLERDVLCVFVTFVDELSALSDRVVSMMSTVAAEDPTRRTFKVIRKPADGLAHALALADRYGLGYERLRQRLADPREGAGERGRAR